MPWSLYKNVHNMEECISLVFRADDRLIVSYHFVTDE
jgi:hypothetical protein